MCVGGGDVTGGGGVTLQGVCVCDVTGCVCV